MLEKIYLVFGYMLLKAARMLFRPRMSNSRLSWYFPMTMSNVWTLMLSNPIFSSCDSITSLGFGHCINKSAIWCNVAKAEGPGPETFSFAAGSTNWIQPPGLTHLANLSTDFSIAATEKLGKINRWWTRSKYIVHWEGSSCDRSPRVKLTLDGRLSDGGYNSGLRYITLIKILIATQLQRLTQYRIRQTPSQVETMSWRRIAKYLTQSQYTWFERWMIDRT